MLAQSFKTPEDLGLRDEAGSHPANSKCVTWKQQSATYSLRFVSCSSG